MTTVSNPGAVPEAIVCTEGGGAMERVFVVLDDLVQFRGKPRIGAEASKDLQEACLQAGARVDGAEVLVQVVPPSGKPSVGHPFPAAPGPGVGRNPMRHTVSAEGIMARSSGSTR